MFFTAYLLITGELSFNRMNSLFFQHLPLLPGSALRFGNSKEERQSNRCLGYWLDFSLQMNPLFFVMLVEWFAPQLDFILILFLN